MSRKKAMVLTIIDGLILSSLLGVAGFLFLHYSHYVTALLWQEIPSKVAFSPIYYLVLGSLGGVLIAWSQVKLKSVGVSANKLMGELKLTSRLTYDQVWPNLVMAFFALIFGGSVGPEAGGLAMIIYLSVWLADKLRYMLAHQEEVFNISYVKRLRMLFNFKNYRQAYDPEKAIAPKKKRFWVALLIGNGSLVFFLLMKAFHHSSFFVLLGKTNWGKEELFVALPLVCLGLFFAKGCQYLSRGIEHSTSYLAKRVGNPLLSIITGLLIGCLGMLAPNLLFSGQGVLTAMPNQLPSALFLITAALLKYAVTEWCLSTSWFGGHIFPILTSSVVFGYGIAELMPTFDQLFVVCLVAMSAAIWLLRSPLLVWLLLALYFPVELLLLSFMIAVGYLIYYRKTKPQKIT